MVEIRVTFQVLNIQPKASTFFTSPLNGSWTELLQEYAAKDDKHHYKQAGGCGLVGATKYMFRFCILFDYLES